jgi:solute carrier family 25 uncoupling protein 8/9
VKSQYVCIKSTYSTSVGFCATLCASPVDVIKTRYMNSEPGTFKGAIDCGLKTFMQEGTSAFYKGFWPSFSRLVSWNIIMWLSYEQLKRVVVRNMQHED